MGLSEDEIHKSRDSTSPRVSRLEAIRTTCGIRSPIDGPITLFDLSIGQVVRPQDELFEIHDTSHVVARGYVHEQESVDVGVDQPVTVTITADPRFSAAGKIDRMAPTLSAWGRAVSVWVELDNRSGELKEGMLARLAIVRERASKRRPTPCIPRRDRIRRTRARAHDERQGTTSAFANRLRCSSRSATLRCAGADRGATMLNRIIAISLKNRTLVLALTVVLLIYGGYVASRLPIDVFPDLNRPTVTILTEAPGLAPEEVETLVTFPIDPS